ncbi:MAG: pyridoxamine 5'-phosphate oxidase family protein [Spirochaetales bacterium]|nr:pyridoxamine 5'-phosphate oxidase family protein [Spirochaetales bacterium]
MNKKEFLEKFNQLLEEGQSGILATINPDGYPSQRYMTPTVIPGKPGLLYAVTARNFAKIGDIDKNPRVSWLFTSHKTREIFSLRGQMRLIDDPRFKSEILEELGKGLETFWKLNDDPSLLVCLETILESAEYFNPKTAEKYQISFVS